MMTRRKRELKEGNCRHFRLPNDDEDDKEERELKEGSYRYFRSPNDDDEEEERAEGGELPPLPAT